MSDLISRQAAIDAFYEMASDIDHLCTVGDYVHVLEMLPSAQPERLTDDDFETIRIHLNAYKEKLCNQQRWEEADEYQRIIDRFMAFASAQPEIVRCKDCRYRDPEDHKCDCGHDIIWQLPRDDKWYCADAERRTDE